MDKNEKKETKLRQKEAKEQAKYEEARRKEIIKEDRERRKNSFGSKVKGFFMTVIFVIILLVAAFFGLKYLLNEKKVELYNQEEIQQIEEFAKSTNKDKLVDLIDKLSALENNVKWSTQKTIIFEAGIIKLCNKQTNNSNGTDNDYRGADRGADQKLRVGYPQWDQGD